jgi:hypothetical protein
MFGLALAISLTGVIYFLLALVVLCFLIVGVRHLLGLAGIALPQPMWALIGFALFLIVLLYALGAFGGGGGVTIR